MPTRWAAGRGPETEHVRDQLSAYLDYELPELERDQVREHLRRCPECENELATLKATKQLLAEMPLQPVPRSFILTPDMVGRPISGPVVVPQRGAWSLAGRLRVAALGFAAILVVMLSSEYLFQGGAPQAVVSSPNISTSSSRYTAPDAGVSGTSANGVVAAAPTTTTAAAAAATGTMSAPAAAAEATSTTAAAAPAEISTTAPAATGAGASQALAGDQAVPSVVAPPAAPGSDNLTLQPGGPATGGAGQAPEATPPPEHFELQTGDQPTAVTPLAAPAPPPPTGGLEIGGLRLVEGGLLLLVLALIGASLWVGRPRS